MSSLILDNALGMAKQVNYICKSCYYQIRNIGLIRKCINDETNKRLDYGNGCFNYFPPPVSL